MQLTQLNIRKISDTAVRLSQRIDDRFAGRGISEIAHHLVDTAEATCGSIERLNRPRWTLRIGVLIAIAFAVVVTVLAAAPLDIEASEPRELSEWLTVLEALIQNLVFIGLAAVFLRGLEGRMKRSEALKDLHSLRSLAHVIDMHQLTKDPERLLSAAQRTKHSPERSMTRFELTRYLDYCSEMLSLIAKLAAMYAQESQDPAVLASVGEIQELSSGLSSEVWQKVILLSLPPTADAQTVNARTA